MPALTCDACNGALVSYRDGLMKCEFCGLLHTPERITQKVQEITGTVEIVRGNAERDRLLQNVRYFIQCNDLDSAKKVLDTLLIEYPQDEEVKTENNNYRAKCCQLDIKKWLDRCPPNSTHFNDRDISQVSSLINLSKKYALNYQQLVSRVKEIYNQYDGYNIISNYQNLFDPYDICKLFISKQNFIKLFTNNHNTNENKRKAKKDLILSFIIFIFFIINLISFIAFSPLFGFGLLLTIPALFYSIDLAKNSLSTLYKCYRKPSSNNQISMYQQNLTIYEERVFNNLYDNRIIN